MNYGSIFIIWGIFAKKCEGDTEKYNRIYSESLSKGIYFFENLPNEVRPLGVLTFWPINVLNTFLIGLEAIKNADKTDSLMKT